MARKKKEQDPIFNNAGGFTPSVSKPHRPANMQRKRPSKIPEDIISEIAKDNGNSLVKMGRLREEKSFISAPHAVKELTEAGFYNYAGRAAQGFNRGANGAVFKYQKFASVNDNEGSEPRYFVVGQAAETIGELTRNTGGAKYEQGYYMALTLTNLLTLHPEGHDNLHILAGMPPSDYRHKETMMKALGGIHRVEYPSGEVVWFYVRSVKHYDEPVGGAWNFLLANNSLAYRDGIDMDGLGLIVDIGGRISSLVPFNATGFIDYENAKSIDLGIQHVMNAVSDHLLTDSAYSKYFQYVRGDLPHDASMRHALQTGIYEVAGYEISALDAVADATEQIRGEIRRVYNQDLGGARAYKYIVVTGGGGGLLYQQLVEHVLAFNPDKVHLSHNKPESQHLANVLGARKMWLGWLAVKAKQNA